MRKNKIGDSLRQLFYRSSSLPILGFVGKAIAERREALADDKEEEVGEINGRKDFLTRFLEIQKGNPNVPPW